MVKPIAPLHLYTQRNLTLVVQYRIYVTLRSNFPRLLCCCLSNKKAMRKHILNNVWMIFYSILSFGAVSASVFRIQTESRGDISFSSEHVNEIVKLMRAYVQALYKRHPPR